MTFLIIWVFYLISISQISSKNFQKAMLSKNKSYITNKIILTLLNNTYDEKNQKEKQIVIIQIKTIIIMDMALIIQIKIILITIQKIKQKECPGFTF